MASRKRGQDRTRSSKPGAAGVREMSRGARPPHDRPTSVEDLFGGGINGNLLLGEYHTEKVYAWFQRRHRRGRTLIDTDGYWRRGNYEWKIPYGVRCALSEQLTFSQIATKYPYYVLWTSPKTHKRLKKYFMSLPAAIDFIAGKAQRVDRHASVVARHGFYIPRKLMGKFPRRLSDGRLYYWCPRCMQPRRFKRNGEEFYADKKFWSDEKQKFIWKNIKLAVMCCDTCGISNRDHKFRASNQPIEKRRIKKGARRVKRRKG